MADLTIATRKSRLALIQTHYVRDRIVEQHPGVTIAITHIETKGDKILDAPLAKIGDKGLFTKEIENALLDGSADLAVHSYKDLPTRLPDGLAVGAVLTRVPNEDVLIAAPGTTLQTLPVGARIGTSSLRRRAQLLYHRPDLVIEDLRGNVNTRIDKFLSGKYDAIVLARAGVMRMGLEVHIAEILPVDRMLPAVGQGALAIEVRKGDSRVLEKIRFLEDPATRAATDAERALLEALQGGCQVPIGAAAGISGNGFTLHGFVASLDGKRYFRDSESGDASEAEAIGRRLAERLLARGAGAVLEEIRAAAPPMEN